MKQLSHSRMKFMHGLLLGVTNFCNSEREILVLELRQQLVIVDYYDFFGKKQEGGSLLCFIKM
jgi:hypothetical protein